MYTIKAWAKSPALLMVGNATYLEMMQLEKMV